MRPFRLFLRGFIFAVLLLAAATSRTGHAQGPPNGLPGNSERRHVDPCEQAAKPQGLALGIQSQCEVGGSGGVAKGDFNGDGFGDLAVGVPFEDIESVENAGAVNVIYGSADGLVATGNQFLRQGANGAAGTAEQDDYFGWSLASGDFNGDDYSDLAVGVSGEDFGELTNPGQVYVYHGSATGLTFARVLDHRDLPSNLPLRSRWQPHANDQFGYSLVWADFNGDGNGDLAIGIPYADVGGTVGTLITREDVGAVAVVYGGPAGLGLAMQAFAQGSTDSSSIGPYWIAGSHTGATLSAGDYDGDGFADLAIGAADASFEDSFGETWLEAGLVTVIYGRALTGLEPSSDVVLSQFFGPGSSAENYDRFGSALASGDFNSDGRDDLAVGVPYEDLSAGADAGTVHTYLGAATGFTLGRVVSQGIAAETGDKFGFALAAADFNGDGRDDLAVGSPGEDHGSTINNAGIVQIFPGTDSFGIAQNATQVWHEDTEGVNGTAQTGDQFGYALSAWNFGRSAHADLAIGVPFQDITGAKTISNVGKVHVLYGTGTGLTAGVDDQEWVQNELCCSASEAGDQFGQAVY